MTAYAKTQWGWVIALVGLLFGVAVQTATVVRTASSVEGEVKALGNSVLDIKETLKPGILPVSNSRLTDLERRMERLERLMIYRNQSLLEGGK